jgi:uncharacterized protein (TIGR00297 family)
MIGLDMMLLYLGICACLSVFAYVRNILDLKGSLLAFVVGAIISILGNILWLVMLLIFLLTSFLLTKYRFELKKQKGLHEGSRGERGYRNVLANGVVMTVIAVFAWIDGSIMNMATASFVFVSALAVAAADTAASEIGVFDPRPVLITNLQRVEPGTNGGVSLTGQLVAFIAAGFTSAIAYLLFSLDQSLVAGPSTILIPMLCGFFGCQVDSVIGATIERKGKIGKDGNNLISIASGALLAWLLLHLMGA